jgi:hypothetical protein
MRGRNCPKEGPFHPLYQEERSMAKATSIMVNSIAVPLVSGSGIAITVAWEA